MALADSADNELLFYVTKQKAFDGDDSNPTFAPPICQLACCRPGPSSTAA